MTRRDALLILSAALWPTVSNAALPSAPRVLKRARRALRRLGGLQVTLVGRQRSGKARFSIGERWIMDPAAQSTRTDTNGPKGLTAGWASGGSLTGDARIAPTAAERAVLHHLFSRTDPAALAKAYGVNTRQSHLALTPDGRIALVVGERQPKSPQLHFDQATGLPLAVRVPTHEGLVELRLMEWGPPPGAGRFPNRIQVRVNGRMRRLLDTQQVRALTARP